MALDITPTGWNYTTIAYTTETTEWDYYWLNTSTNTTLPVSMASDDEQPIGLQFVFWCEAVVIPMITALGIVTNLISLFVLPKSNIVAVFKYCLIGLTLSDLGAAITGFAQMAIEMARYGGNPPFGLWSKWALANYTLYYMSSMFLGTSATFVIYIVVIRKIIVWKPLKTKQLLTIGRIRTTMILIFLVTLCLFAPTCLTIIWTLCFADIKTQVCIDVNAAVPNLRQVAFPYIVFLTTLYGPVLLLFYVICLVSIHATLKKHMEFTGLQVAQTTGAHASSTSIAYDNGSTMSIASTNHNGSTPSVAMDASTMNAAHAHKGPHKIGRHKKNRMQSKMQKITTTLTLILILDMLCTLPLCAQALCLIVSPLTTVFSEDNIPYKVFDVLVEMMLYLKPAYNFWLYVFSHREFREVIKKWCCLSQCCTKVNCHKPTIKALHCFCPGSGGSYDVADFNTAKDKSHHIPGT